MEQMSRKMLDQVCRTYREASASNAEFAGTAKEMPVERMIELIEEQLKCQQQLEEYRLRPLWALKPGAWKARRARNANKRQLEQLKKTALERLIPNRHGNNA